MYINGIGRTKFGNLSQSLPELAYEAIYNALEDSPNNINDIGAIFVSNFLGGPLNSQLHLNSIIASFIPGINIPILRIETACASSSVALNQALNTLEKFKNVLIVGVEKMAPSNGIGEVEAISMAADRNDQSNGLIFPANYALIAQQYMLKYGINHDVFSEISYLNHKNANLNPFAHYYDKKITMDKIINSPIIASPLNLFDCSPISDGAVALVISKEKKSERDVEILSSQFVTDSISLTQRDDLTSFKAIKIATAKALKESELNINNIDILEVHDCFTIGELIALEDLGLCKPGEASKLVYDGYISIEGDQPVNTDGGLKADGHPIGASGLAQIYEIMVQIRGEAGKRQVSDVKTGLAHNIGGIGGTGAITILGSD
jgi:acetyl-CoA C-acetyltransferase